jgi:hypothetical protein
MARDEGPAGDNKNKPARDDEKTAYCYCAASAATCILTILSGSAGGSPLAI